MTREQTSKVNRRGLFHALSAGASAALISAPFAGEARADTEATAEKLKARYQESDHVKTFYRVNRYPTK